MAQTPQSIMTRMYLYPRLYPGNRSSAAHLLEHGDSRSGRLRPTLCRAWSPQVDERPSPPAFRIHAMDTLLGPALL